MPEEQSPVLVAEFTLDDFIQTYLHYYGSYVLEESDLLEPLSDNLLEKFSNKTKNVNLFDRLSGNGYQEQYMCFRFLERVLRNGDSNLEQYLERVLHRYQYKIENNKIKIVVGKLTDCELTNYRKNLMKGLSGRPIFYYDRY